MRLRLLSPILSVNHVMISPVLWLSVPRRASGLK